MGMQNATLSRSNCLLFLASSMLCLRNSNKIQNFQLVVGVMILQCENLSIFSRYFVSNKN